MHCNDRSTISFRRHSMEADNSLLNSMFVAETAGIDYSDGTWRVVKRAVAVAEIAAVVGIQAETTAAVGQAVERNGRRCVTWSRPLKQIADCSFA